MNSLKTESIPLNPKPTWMLLSVWIGFIIVAGTMVAGGALTESLSFYDIVVLTLIANFILGGVAAVSGYIGAKTRYTFAQLSKFAFPGVSHRLVSLYVPTVLTFWFSVLASILGQYLSDSAGLSDEFTLPISMALCFLLSITSYFGIRYLGILSIITVPGIFVLAGYAVFTTTLEADQASFSIADLESVNIALGIIISTWIMGATLNAPDITRFARTARIGALIAFLGISIGNSFNIIVGARAALIGGTADPAPLLIALGLPALGFILVVSNLWTTNDNNMYSASLGFSEAAQLPRKKSVLALSTLAAALVLLDIGNLPSIMNGIMVMGATAPALAAVVFSGYLSAQKKKETSCQASLFPWHAWIAWFIGAGTSLYMSGLTGLLTGTLIAFLVHRGFNNTMLRWQAK